MVKRVDAEQAERLMAKGALFLDALPETIYVQEHLPGAKNLPLESLDADAAKAVIDEGRDLVVYCFDQHCDLSARTSARLEQLGYDRVHDLIGGRAAWTVLGKPTEGEVGDRRRISEHVHTAATVAVDGMIGDATFDGELPVAVLGDDEILLGALNPAAASLPPATPVVQAMITAPGTIRPDLRIEEVKQQLSDDGLDHVFVTAVSGRLIGLAVNDELHV